MALDPEDDDCVIPVVATDPDGTRVFEADITMWVTPRKRPG